jgi:N-acetylglucosamine-6-sulfatase
MAGDHGRLHKVVFYEASIRIPLIVRWPGHGAAKAVAEEMVESIDVGATLLEAAGVAPMQRGLGRSLRAAPDGPMSDVRDDVLSEVRGEAGVNTFMLRTERYKYALDATGEGYLLHDLEADPDEQVNLIGHPEHQALEAELRERVFRRLLHDQPMR